MSIDGTAPDLAGSSQPYSANALRLRPLSASSQPAFPLGHPYFEIVYAPLLGPTATLLARNLLRHLTIARGPVTVLATDIALELGLRASSDVSLGRRSHLRHALDRLAHDRIIRWLGDADIGVHVAVPPLGPHALKKLPGSARRVHEHFVAALADDHAS